MQKQRTRSSHVIGTVRMTRGGTAFVVPDAVSERELGDIFIRREHLEGVLERDQVRVRVTSVRRFRREGQIEIILNRPYKAVVGRLVLNRGGASAESLDDSFPHPIQLSGSKTAKWQDGQIVTVEITTPPIAGYPAAGRVIETLGFLGDEGIDTEIVIRKHHLRREFPAPVLEETSAISHSIPVQECGRRRDLRGQCIFTIDGPDARDFDDAVSISERGDGGFELGVHIADVSHYVQEGSALDAEACQRGTSVYFPRKVLPMLPPKLSDEVCSLRPGEDRLTMTALINLDPGGELESAEFFESVIHSNARLTYGQVQAIFEDNEESRPDLPAEVIRALAPMKRLALLRIESRRVRGAIDFDLPEPEIVYDEEFQISSILPSKRFLAHQLIEEFMILANSAVARRLHESGIPSIYRAHDEPDPDRTEVFARIAAAFGYRFNPRPPITPADYQKIARQFEGKKEGRLLAYRLLRSLSLARYTTDQGKHFGLALEHYAHFTSPIRRYPDLVVHRQLKRLLQQRSSVKPGARASGKLDRSSEKLSSQLSEVSELSSRREREAEAAERELFNWKKAEFLSKRIGEHFSGIITEVREYGMFVELEENLVDGLVSISSLADDEYRYYPKTHSIVGERGRSFRLGDRIEVIVDRVDRDRQLVDFSVYAPRSGKKRRQWRGW